MKPFFSLQNVSFSYDDNCIFETINLDFFRQEVIVISGENGTGKTTLCKILFRLYKQFSGDILFEEKDLPGIDIDYITSKISFIQEQTQHGFLGATPDEDLAIWQHKFQRRDDETFKAKRNAIFERFGINHISNKPIWELSSGQQKMVVLASLLLNMHKFWILDDPLFSLDSNGINTLLSILAQHKLSGSGALIATQRPHIFSLVADSIYEIKGKKLSPVLGK